MSNALVAYYRRAIPKDTAGLDDAALTEQIAANFEKAGTLDAYLRDYPDFHADLLNIRNAGGDVVRETMTAAKVGVMDRLPGTMQGAGALAADALAREEMMQAIGLDTPLRTAGDSLRGMARENSAEAAARTAESGGRTIRRFEDVRPTSPRDFMLWALPTFAENSPSMLASLGTAAATGLVTKNPAAMMTVAGATSIAQNAGDVYNDLNAEGAPRDRAITGAIAAGIPMGLLDMASELLPLAKLTGVFKSAGNDAIVKSLAGVMGKGGLAGAGRGALTQMLAEGGTETLQELIAIAGEEYATGKPVAPEEVRTRLINSAAGGAVVGGPTGALFGLIPNETNPAAPTISQPNGPTAAASAGVVSPTPAAPLATAPGGPAMTPPPPPPDPLAFDPYAGLGESVVPGGATPFDRMLRAPRVDPYAGLAEAVGPDGATPFDNYLAIPQAPRPDALAGIREMVGPDGVTPVDTLLQDSSVAERESHKLEAAGSSPAPAPTPPVATEIAQPSPGSNILPAATPAPVATGTLSIADFAPARIAKTTSNDLTGDGARGGRYAIAIEKDGRVEVRNVYERKDGSRIVENTADLVPEVRVKGTGRSLETLRKQGWTVRHEPFQLAVQSPQLRASFTPAQFDAEIAHGRAAHDLVANAINEGRGDIVVEAGLRAVDPDGWAAVEFLRDKIAADTGASPSHALIGLGTRVDSKAERDTLRTAATAKKLAAGDLLRRKEGKVFGLFTDAQWTGFKARVAAGGGDAALAEMFAANPAAQTGWMLGIANLGTADQIGDKAFKSKGATGTLATATASLDEKPKLIEKLSNVAAEEDTEVDAGESPAMSGGAAARAFLLEHGFDDNAIHAAVVELLSFEDLTAADISDVIYTLPEAQGFFKSLKKSGPAKGRVLLETATQHLFTLHDEANGRSGKSQVGSVNLAQASGVRQGIPGAGGPDAAAPVKTPGSPLRSQPAAEAGRWRAPSAQVARAWGFLTTTLREWGMDVSAVQAAADEVDAFYRQTGGRTDARRFIELVLKSLAAPTPTDLEVVVHEGVHVLFAAQPADVREALHRAVAKLPEPDPSSNRSLQSPDPEVRMQEKLAVSLQGGGMDAGTATDFASRLVRFVKDLYFRTARALAAGLGAGEMADAFALRYFRNRLDGLMQGDYAPKSLVNALGGRPLTWAERAVMLPGFGRSLGRVVNGSMQWAPKVPDTREAVAYNLDLAFSRPPADESEINVRKGIEAVNAVLADRTQPVRGAMFRPEVGSITFEWGETGNPAKAFHGGYGIGHILARRSVVDGLNPYQVLSSLIETIAYGDASSPYGGEGDTRVRIDDGTNSVILSLARHGKRETWVITTFDSSRGKKGASVTEDGAKDVPSKPTAQAARAFSSEDLVAVTDGLKLGTRLRVVKDGGLLYSQPAETALGSNAPVSAIHRDLAALNHAIDTDAVADRALSQQPAVLAAANVMQLPPIEWLRRKLRLDSPVTLKNSQLLRPDPATGQPVQGINPAQRFGDIGDTDLATAARHHAYEAQQRVVRTASAALTETRASLLPARNRLQHAQDALLDEHRNYLNQEKLTPLVQAGVMKLLARERRLGLRTGKQIGEVMQQLRELDARSDELIDRDYAPVFRKLFQGDELRGRNLFTLLDLLVNEVKVEFGDKIGDIRRRVAERVSSGVGTAPELGLLVADTPGSKALLATVVAYGKANASVLLQLERRRLQNVAERMALQTQLDAVIAERDITNRAVRDLSKTAKLEERARILYQQRKRALQPLASEVTQLETLAAALTSALPVWQQSLADLQAQVGAQPDVEFSDGMTYHVPTVNAQGRMELTPHTLRLDTNRGATDVATLQRHLATMTAFLGAMERAGTRTAEYFAVKAERDALAKGYWEPDVRKSDAWITANLFAPVSDVLTASGLPGGRLLAQMVRKLVSVELSLRQSGTREGVKTERARDAVVAVLNRGRKRADMTLKRYELTIAQPALAILDSGTADLRDLPISPEARAARGMQRVINHLLANPDTADFVRGKESAVSAALWTHLKQRANGSELFHSANKEHGLGVRDERLIVPRGDGTETVGVRAAIQGNGILTVSKTTNDLGGVTYRALKNADWATMPDALPGLVDAYRQGGAAGLQAALAQTRYFADPHTVQNFVGAMAENPIYGIFDAPVATDGVTRAEADADKTAAAWRASGGDVVAFIEQMYADHHGKTDRALYVEAMLTRMADYFALLGERLDPAETGMVPTDLSGLTSDLMIDARTAQRWPAAWTRYLEFTVSENHRLAQRVAAQAAFDRGTRKLASLWTTLDHEVKTSVDRLTTERGAVEMTGMTGKALEKELAARLGEEEYTRLKRLEALAPRLDREKDHLRAYFLRAHSTVDGNNFVSALGSFIARGMLNNPGTALGNLSDLFAPLLHGGISGTTLRHVASNWKELGSGIAGSLAQAVGLDLKLSSDEARAYVSEGHNDAATALEYIGRTEDGFRSDLASQARTGPAGALTKGLQLFSRTMDFAITPRGEQSNYTGLRPLAPFQQFVLETMRASTIATWRRVGNMVQQGMDYFHAHPAQAMDPTFVLTADALGLKGAERNAFETYRIKLAEGYGLTLAGLVREAMDRQAGPSNRMALLSKTTRGLIQGMVASELILDANPATMALNKMTDAKWRLVLPLWGWPIRRALQVARLGLDPQEKLRIAVVARGLGALGVMAGAGLALSLLLDEYHEEIVGRKRNLRSLKGLPETMARGDVKETFFTILENVNRAGTFGLWGEVVNTGVNVSAGEGDNRAISFDQRVVMMSSMLSLKRALTTAIAQEADIDYAGVVRPSLMALGGNSALQYLQIGNRALGLDNAESRFVEKVDTQNRLRVVGRTLGLEVRTPSGAMATPTPLTPIVSRMVLAAYAGDRTEFLTQWREAVQEARALGKEDPVGYVRDSFASRHPLKNVFRSVSQGDYARILRTLDDDGRAEVRSAVARFNAYAESLDAKAFTGSATTRLDPAALRKRLLGL